MSLKDLILVHFNQNIKYVNRKMWPLSLTLIDMMCDILLKLYHFNNSSLVISVFQIISFWYLNFFKWFYFDPNSYILCQNLRNIIEDIRLSLVFFFWSRHLCNNFTKHFLKLMLWRNVEATRISCLGS